MTLEEYIANPMGKNNASNTPLMREAAKANYRAKFDNVMLKENGTVNFYLYKDSQNNAFYAHIKVPSEVIKNFYYDTIFKFTTSSDKNTEGGNNLEKYQIHFFSNDPAFVYTHANTYIRNDLFITELTPRMSKQAVQQPAKEKNPTDALGYVKSIFFAYLYMKNRGLFKKVSYSAAQEFNLKTLMNNIMPADQKLALREDEERKRDKRKKVKVDENLARKLSRYDLSDKARERMVVTTKKTATVKKTSAVNTIKKKGKK